MVIGIPSILGWLTDCSFGTRRGRYVVGSGIYLVKNSQKPLRKTQETQSLPLRLSVVSAKMDLIFQAIEFLAGCNLWYFRLSAGL